MEVQNGAATVKNSLAVPPHIKHIYMPAAQSCPTLRGPKDCSLSDSSIHGIFQARILEWLPFPLPGDLPDPGIEPAATALQAVSLPYESPAAAAAKSLQSVRLCATP